MDTIFNNIICTNLNIWEINNFGNGGCRKSLTANVWKWWVSKRIKIKSWWVQNKWRRRSFWEKSGKQRAGILIKSLRS